MITGSQMRAARALLGIDQKALAELAGLSVPTIQRMEASTGNVRGVVDSLTKGAQQHGPQGNTAQGSTSHTAPPPPWGAAGQATNGGPAADAADQQPA